MAMFKSILPSRKMPDADFLIVTPQTDSHKENYPALSSAPATTKTKSKKSKDKDTPMVIDAEQTEQAFDELLVRDAQCWFRLKRSETCAE